MTTFISKHKMSFFCFCAGLAFAIISSMLTGCGKAQATQAYDTSRIRVVEVRSPVNVVCYTILEDDSRAVGGSCLPMR